MPAPAVVRATSQERDPNWAPEWVARHGGKVWRDAGKPERPIFDLRFSGPDFDDAAFAEVAAHLPELDSLRRLELTGTSIGDASLARVTKVTSLEQLILRDTRITDAGLVHVGKLVNLRSLSLAGTHVSAVGLAELASLRRLAVLTLDRTDIVDADLAAIGRMTSLDRLSISETRITAAGLAHLEPLNLEQLSIPAAIKGDEALGHYLAAQKARTRINLRRWPVTDVGMAHLAKQSRLRWLFITETKVGNEGLRHLKDLKELELLHAGRLDVDSTGLEHLRDLPKLRALFVYHTNVDDDAIEVLSGLPLRLLNANGTKITPQGVAALKRALPDARIVVSAPEKSQ